jgi:DNA-binding transcriptional MerR regulator
VAEGRGVAGSLISGSYARPYAEGAMGHDLGIEKIVGAEDGEPFLTIEELARVTGFKARTIRSYQTKGLLAPPERSGRVAAYNNNHVKQLQRIASLIGEGFTLAGVTALLRRDQIESNRKPETLLPLPAATIEALEEINPSAPEILESLGILERDETGQLATSTLLVASSGALYRLGIPLDVIYGGQLEIAEIGKRIGESLALSLDDASTSQEVADQVTEIGAQLFTATFGRALAKQILRQHAD